MKKTVSRVLVFALAAITVFTSGISHRAFAAVPSPTSNQVQVTGGTVSVNGTVTNISDKLKCTILTDATSDPNMTQTEKDRLSDSFQTLKKESASADFSAVAMFDVHLVEDEGNAISDAIKANGLTLTFQISGGLEAGKTYRFYHCASTSNPDDLSTWEQGPCIIDAVKGTCQITIHSLSPIAVVVDQKNSSVTSSSANGNSVAPATGSNATDHNSLILWIIIGAVAVCGVVAIGVYMFQAKKKSHKED